MRIYPYRYVVAFLSIRHKEMIPKVKAILHYSLQNAAELFTPDLMTRRKEDTLESAFIEQEQAKCQEIHEIHQKETSSSMGVSESGTGGYGTPFHVPTNSTHVFNTPFQCNEQAVKEESTAGNDVEMSAVSNDGKYPDLSIDLSTTQTQTHAIPQGGDEGQCTPTSPRARAVHQQQQVHSIPSSPSSCRSIWWSYLVMRMMSILTSASLLHLSFYSYILSIIFATPLYLGL